VEDKRLEELRIQLNGEPRDVPAKLTLAGLVSHLGFAADRLAIELNDSVIRRAEWANTFLSENDRVEVVHFVGGGGK
jgi:thiamine biosynthesis protein ThiS